MLAHRFIFMVHHWRTALAVVAVAVLLWLCLPRTVRGKLWDGWKKFGHAIGNVNARILLTLLYAIVILPFGLIIRLFSDSLHTKKRPVAWFDHPPIPNTLDEARRQG